MADTHVTRIRRSILAALATGISNNDDLAARAALGRVDPIVRGRAKKQLANALVDAELAVVTAGIARPTRAHVQRIAALTLTGAETEPLAGDPEAAEAAYRMLRRVRAPRFPIVTLVTALALLGIAGAVAFTIETRPGPKPRTYRRPMPPPSAAAYRDGGVPLRDPKLDQLFTTQLTDLVVGSSRGTVAARNDLVTLRATNLHHGAALQTAWTTALDAYGAAVDRPNTSQDALKEPVRELTEELAKAGLGYFLEGRIKDGHPIIQAYSVDEVVIVTAGDKPRRVLSVRRLDRLNTAYAVLGMHDADAGDPVLHLDRIDEHVATTELPVLAPDASYPLAEDTWLATPEGTALAKQIGISIRAEYAGALGADAAAATKIAALLAERATIVEEWRSHLDKKNIVFVSTDDLFLPENLVYTLQRVVPHYQQERIETIEATLAELEAPRIHSRVRELVSATVRRHEAQHGFDFDRETELHYPQPLVDLLGPPHDNEGNPIAIVRAARAELSGYLSQILNDPATPQSTLWHLGQQVFTRDRWGTGEFYAGLVVLQGLAKQLGADVSGRTFHRGLDRERLAKLELVVANASDAKLREAAKALWTELYGEPPTMIVERAHPVIATR